MPRGIPGSGKKKKRGKIGRPKKFAMDKAFKIRFPNDLYQLVMDIAYLENASSTRTVTCADLIRDAVSFVYRDGERMRECFKRSRYNSTRRLVPRMP